MSTLGQSPAPSDPTAAQHSAATPVLSIVSFVLSAVAVFFIPILFGGAAIVTAAIAMTRRQRWGKVALVVAIAATVLGMVLGVLAVNAAMQN